MAVRSDLPLEDRERPSQPKVRNPYNVIGMQVGEKHSGHIAEQNLELTWTLRRTASFV